MPRQFLTAVALLGLAILGGCFSPIPKQADPGVPEPLPAVPDPLPSEIGRWAGIDVGSKGVKPIVLTFVQTPEGWDFVTDTSIESKNTDLGTPAEGDGGFDRDRFTATVATVGEMVKTIREKHKLPPDRVRVVVSSGVFTRIKDKDKAAAAKAELTVAIENVIGFPPAYVTDRQEAELAARAIISPANRAGRMVIDVGSGNTKFGWYTAKGFQNATLDSGTKAFRDKVAKLVAEKKKPFAEAAAELRESELVAPLQKKLASVPPVDQINNVQIIGGAAWALSTLTHPGTSRDTRVPLSAADLDQFTELVRLKPDEVRMRVLKSVTDPAIRETAKKEVERVQNVFSPEELQAGAEILRAAFGELKLGGTGKKIVFFQKGQYAWIAGYLMNEAKLPE